MPHAPGSFDEAVKPEESSFLTLSPLDTHHSTLKATQILKIWVGPGTLHFYQVFLAFPISPYQLIQNSPV